MLDAVIDTFGVVQRCCRVIAVSGNAANQQQVERLLDSELQWLKWVYSGTSDAVSPEDGEGWLMQLATCIRELELPLETRVDLLHAVNAAIYSVRDGDVTVTRNDLWQWSQAIGWSQAVGIVAPSGLAITAESEVTPLTANGGSLSGKGYEFSDAVIAATVRMLKMQIQNLAAIDALEVYREWTAAVSSDFGIPNPCSAFDHEASSYGGGCYQSIPMRVSFSVVNEDVLLHEYRHHLQHMGLPMPVADMEEDARRWSAALHDAAQARLWADSPSGDVSPTPLAVSEADPAISKQGFRVLSPSGAFREAAELASLEPKRFHDASDIHALGVVFALHNFGAQHALPYLRWTWQNRERITSTQSALATAFPEAVSLTLPSTDPQPMPWHPDTFTLLYVYALAICAEVATAAVLETTPLTHPWASQMAARIPIPSGTPHFEDAVPGVEDYLFAIDSEDDYDGHP